MKRTLSVALAFALMNSGLAADDGVAKRPLRVLYVGNTDTDRGQAYARFLGEKFTLVGARERKTFQPESIGDEQVDVVVLDWSQGDIRFNPAQRAGELERNVRSPLGERSKWSLPTVLLGSAGHLLAAPWKVFGGTG
jgi:hypothetical protein